MERSRLLNHFQRFKYSTLHNTAEVVVVQRHSASHCERDGCGLDHNSGD